MKAKTALLGFLVASQSIQLQAANLTWDANGATLPNPFDGATVWTNANLFYNGAANVTWPVGTGVTDVAVFGANPGTPYSGIPGAVSFTTAISAGGVTFNPYIGNAVKYNLSGGTGGSLTLNGTPVIAVETNWLRPFAAINGILAGTAGFDVTTTTGGILEIGTQANTITGTIRLKSGSSLSIGGDTSFGGVGNGISFDGTSTLITRTTNTPATTRSFNIAAGSTAKFDSLTGQTLTLASTISESGGAGILRKEGLGGLTLTTGCSYTGRTEIRQGTLTLNFANVTAPVAPTSDIINNASSLRMFGGTLAVTGKASTANTQTFAGLTLDPGISNLNSTAGATGGTTAVTLGTITRNPGATLNVATIAAGTSYATSTGNSNGILGGFATVNFADWATVTGGNLAANATYQTGTDATLWAAADNVSMAATPLTPLAGSATVNSVKFTAGASLAIPASQTLTLTSGGVLVTGTGTNSITGGNLQGAAGADLVVHQHDTTVATTISSAIIDNSSPTALTKVGAGTLILTGTNLYSGNTYLSGGTLDVSSDSNLGTGIGATLTARQGTTLRISGGSAFSSAKNFQFDLGSDSFGGGGLGGGPNAGGNFNVDVTNTAGATISGAFNVSAGTMVKAGAGTLTLTNPGVNHLARLNGGLALTVNNGSLVFSGGASSEWQVGQGEFTIGDNTPNVSTVVVNSGTVSAGSWISIGRGNGTTGLQSGLTVNGGTVNTGNLYTGFGNGVGSYNAKPFITAANDAVINVTDSIRISETPGADSTMSISGTSSVKVNNSLQLGFGGKGTLNISDSASFGTGQLWLGGNNAAANTAAGVVNQSGGSFAVAGFLGTGTSGDWRIGGFTGANDSLAYGAYTTSGGTFDSGNRNIQIGAFGIGVVDVRGGTFTTNTGAGFPVVGRFAGGFGLLDVSSGFFNQNGSGQLLIIGEAGTGQLNVSGTGTVTAVGGAGGAGNGGGTGGIRTGHTAGAVSNVNLNGGTILSSGVAKSNNALTTFSYIYLNGGSLKANASNTTYLQGHDNTLVGPSGAKIDTNGQSITIGQDLLRADTTVGLKTIPVATGGAGYMGPPIVRITGGAGVGASAIANVSGGAVTSITITNPGTGYLGAPTVSLLGGGFATAATLGTATFGANDADGGLVKSGPGTLTLAGTSTYTGATSVTGDTLSVTGTLTNSAVTVDPGCTIKGTGTIANTLTVAGTLAPGLSAGTLNAGPTVLTGSYSCEIVNAIADRINVNGNLTLSGSTLDFVLPGLPAATSYIIASYTGTLTGTFAAVNGLPGLYQVVYDGTNKQIRVEGSPYASWADSFGLDPLTTGAPGNDFDQDGLSNELEFVLGVADPTLSSQADSPTSSIVGTDLVFTFLRRDGSEVAGSSVTVEVGTTLTAWPTVYSVAADTASSTAGVVVTENGTNPDLITVTIPQGADPAKFARLKVVLSP
ncbi:MAG: autotransporter-associated beta strand repeat-containing protein [Verrucomicrobiota bacterium]